MTVLSPYTKMYEKAGLDAVIVATPDHLHLPMTMDALDAGLHVLCEKPLALNSEQAEEMLNKAQSSGLKHMTNFSFRLDSEFRYLGQLLKGNEIGNWFEFRGSWLAGMYLDSELSPYLEAFQRSRRQWRLDRAKSNGVLGDFGSHFFDLVQTYFSPISSLSASLLSRKEPGRLEKQSKSSIPPETISIVLRLENGVHGTLNISKVANVTPAITLEVYGEGGFIRSVYGKGLSEVSYSHGDHEEPTVLEIPDLLKNTPAVSELFLESIRDDKTISPTFEDGLYIQKVMDAAIESDETGKWVTV